MKDYQNVWIFVLCLYCCNGIAQGPPITSDKPIMLGGKSILVRALTEIRTTDLGTFTEVAVMSHYLPSSRSLIAVHIPFVTYNFKGSATGSGQTLGDIELMLKYQLYAKDGTGKTFRVIAKTLQSLPTGKKLGILGISTGTYQSYVGVVAGYESIKFGITTEVGYNVMFDSVEDEFRYKLGFGLPLLRPSYPVNQLNLYFEYQSSWYTEIDDYKLLYAQGIQYAKGKFTFEAAVQFPLLQDTDRVPELEQSFFLGTRYVF